MHRYDKLEGTRVTAVRILAGLGAAVAAVSVALPPVAHADPVPALYDTVCRTLDNFPSVYGVKRMMRNFQGMFLTQQAAWDTIVEGMASQCPEHADVVREFAMIYGGDPDI